MKQQFVKPLIEIVEISNDDIITTSPNTEYSGGEHWDSDLDFD